jgi:hypothetical protein
MQWTNQEHYFVGQGPVLGGLRNADGSPKGLRHFGNCSALKITVATSVEEHKESKTGQRGVDLRIQKETKCSFQADFEDFSNENWELFSRGKATTILANAAAVATVKGYPGLITGLPHLKVTITTVAVGAVTLTPYVDAATDWDYKVNADAGSIMLNGGANVDALPALANGATYHTLTVTYAHDAQVRIDGLTAAAAEVFFRFEGLNTVDENSPVVVEIFRVSTDPFKDIALIGDAVNKFTIDGSVLQDPSRGTGEADSAYFNVRKL